MNVMYQIEEYFVRLREDASGRMKLTVEQVWRQGYQRLHQCCVAGFGVDKRCSEQFRDCC